MATDTVLTDAQCLAIGAFGQSPIKRLDHARAIEQAVLQSPEVQRLREDAQWQPIETAPKDGTEIVLLFAEETTVIGRVRPRVRAAAWLGDWTIPYRRSNPPTHWMPLPPPPQHDN